MKKQSLLYTIVLVSMIILLVGMTCTGSKKEMQITTTSQEALDLFRQGRVLWEKVRLEDSAPYFEKAIAKDSVFAMAYYYRAFSQNSTAGFFNDLNKAASLADHVSEGERLFLSAVKADFIDNDPAAAKALYQKLASLYPKDKRVHSQLGLYYTRQRNYGMAVEELKKAVDIDPDFSAVYNQLGYGYISLGDFDEAESAFRKYAELIPDEPNPHDSYGEVLMKQGKFDQSIHQYKTALSLNPQFYFSYVGLGSSLLFQGHADQAREAFQKYFDVAPDDTHRRNALLAMARSYVYEGDLQKAMKVLKKRYSISEKNNNLLDMADDTYQMAEILLEMGNLNEAMLKYQKNSELLQQSVSLSAKQKSNLKQGLYFNEVRLALKNNDLETAKDKAEVYTKQAVTDNDPSEIQDAHELAGMIALHEKRYEDALQELQQANLQNPRNLCRIAKTYAGKGETETAKMYLEKAVHFNNMGMNFAFIRNRAKKMLDAM